MRMQMETQVVVETFEEVGMTNPFATNASLEETLSYADEVDIDVDESLLLLGGHDEQVGFIIIQL